MQHTYRMYMTHCERTKIQSYFEFRPVEQRLESNEPRILDHAQHRLG